MKDDKLKEHKRVVEKGTKLNGLVYKINGEWLAKEIDSPRNHREWCIVVFGGGPIKPVLRYAFSRGRQFSSSCF